MSERLDRIEAQQELNTANIADLITLSGNVLRAVDGLTARIDESNQRFDILREEAAADRRRYDERFDRILLAIRGVSDRVDNLEQAS